MSMITRALVLLSVVVAAGAIRSGGSAAAPPPGVDAPVLRAASGMLAHHSRQQVLRWLRQQRDIRRAVLGRDGRTLDVRFRDGAAAAILPARLSSVRVTGSARDLSEEPLAPSFHLLARSHAPAARALVLEPFATELGLGPTAGDLEAQALKSAGFQVDQAYDTNVTVATMATLSKYNVVYMQTHSGVSSDGESVVATGQLANNDPSMASLVADGSVITVGVAGSRTQLYYGITSHFIKYHEGQFPANSLLFLNGCALLRGTIFWQALASRGAGVMVSWDQDATSADDYLVAAAFFNQLTQGASVSAAVSALQAAGYGTSTVEGVVAHFGYLGDGSITLASSAASAPPMTATPRPTPTATPIPQPSATATATPLPTASPTPAKLSIQLQPRVVAGHQQVIRIQALPHMVVHIRVRYPDGDRHTVTGTTGPAGTLTTAFKQPASKVSRRSRWAMVTVTAGTGAAAVQRAARYWIPYSHLDLSVVPRAQAPGGLVTFWVHTRKRTWVSAWLHQDGQKHVLRGRTGRLGWVHLHYRIPVATARGKVVVRAQVRLPHGVYHAKSTLRVR